ncbi:MAG TPA: hypothetical protein VIR56_01985 [Solimonas sp.]
MPFTGSSPVLIEWLDSAQPIPGWRLLSDLPNPDVVKCESVGWIIGETDDVLMLAPNIGDRGGDSEQASGFIRIPVVSITRRVTLLEAEGT